MNQQQLNHEYQDDGLDLVYASEENDMEECMNILKNTKQDINMQDAGGMTPLMYSIKNKNKELTKTLICDYKANTRLYNKKEIQICRRYQENMRMCKGKPQNAMMLAILKVDNEAIKLILEKPNKKEAMLKKQINESLKYSYNFTFESKEYEEVYPEEYKVLDEICKYQTEKQVKSLNLYIGFCAEKRMVNYCQKVIEYQDINERSHCGNVAIEMAARVCNYTTCKLFIEHGADVNLYETQFGETALTISSFLGFHRIVKLLMENGGDPDYKDKNGENSMQKVVRGSGYREDDIEKEEINMEKTEKILLENGGKPEIQEHYEYLEKYIKQLRNYEKIIKFQEIYKNDERLKKKIEKQRLKIQICIIKYISEELKKTK